MDYKQKYEQALSRAKALYAKGAPDSLHLEEMFPELKENEDERIRKELIEYLRKRLRSGFNQEVVICKDGIAWLEKQGVLKPAGKTQVSEKLYERIRNTCACIDDALSSETLVDVKDYLEMASVDAQSAFNMIENLGEQKPADKVEPKFKIGDWVVQGKMLYQIEKVTNLPDNHFQYWTTDGVWFGDGTEAHLWTIQDAKDGDILSNEDMVLIFKCFEEPSYRQHIIAHIGLDTCSHIQITNESWNLGLDGAHPATKEQRDLLFQKMKEAGYEWDAEKKELKKIEQKPAAYFYCKYGGVMPLCSDCKRNHLNSKYKTEEIETWMVPALRCTRQCFSYIQQKPAGWSKEDEEIIKCLNNCLDELEKENG